MHRDNAHAPDRWDYMAYKWLDEAVFVRLFEPLIGRQMSALISGQFTRLSQWIENEIPG